MKPASKNNPCATGAHCVPNQTTTVSKTSHVLQSYVRVAQEQDVRCSVFHHASRSSGRLRSRQHHGRCGCRVCLAPEVLVSPGVGFVACSSESVDASLKRSSWGCCGPLHPVSDFKFESRGDVQKAADPSAVI